MNTPIKVCDTVSPYVPPLQDNPTVLIDGEEWEVIHTYSRAQAIEDGVLIDANFGDLAEVSRQHFKYPIAMTSAVFGIIEDAVNDPRWANDWKGVWHDICWMSHKAVIQRSEDSSTVLFKVVIRGAGRKELYTFKMVCGPNDDASPCLTLMLPEED